MKYPAIILWAAMVSAVSAASTVPTENADLTAVKVELLSQALLARDAGDLTTARKNLEALLALRPADETVRALLAGLEKAPTKTVQVTGGDAAEEAEALARAAEARLAAQIAAARTDLTAAQQLQKQGDAAGARAVADRALTALPENSLTQSLRAELAAVKSAQSEIPVPAAARSAPPAPASVGPQRAQTTGTMLAEVTQAWHRPAPLVRVASVATTEPAGSELGARLDRIVFPTITFTGLELGRVVNTLSALSVEYDRAEVGPKGVNIVLLDQGGANPPVNLTLRDLSLRRILDYITSAVGYHYEIQGDAVVVRPASGVAAMETEFFPISRSTVLRLTGRSPTGASPGAAPRAGITPEMEGQAIRTFLQLAGVTFDGVPGATLAFDGSQLIVTQTPRNRERVRNILRRYSAVRQVEIEAKFMEVQQGALEQLGVQWSAKTKASQLNAGAQASYTTGDGINRTLSDAFRNATTSQQISVTGTGQGEGGLTLPANAPTIPGGVLLGAGAAPLADLKGVVGEFDVNAIVRALSQQSGTELLSAPKLTVLSGNEATITVAQEMRYPQSYGQIQSQVGTGSISGGGSAGVSITSGTPQEFTSRNVGVELKVTPTVEEDDYSISLELNPKVTEFEGFVEYGGPSIAISGGTTVTVPPGFYQPIFAVREMATRVTLWDGATLMMGGLTREEVKKVNDKVPVLGSLPLIGRLFRSKGESTQKRNLLIFVTANLVTPGGGRANPPAASP